jgi:saccharopine dehydrogenase-like NADP-dependent oxidoreductase
LPAFRFFLVADMIHKEEKEQAKGQMRAAAFSAWQINSAILGVFGQKYHTFYEHLENMGLMDEDDKKAVQVQKFVKAAQERIKQQEAAKNVDKILMMDKKRKKHPNRKV